MPDNRRTRPPAVDALVAAARTYANNISAADTVFQYRSWQEEGWHYWRTLGEFNQGITWLANALSRVRLLAAEEVPGGDEPQILKDGPAATLMQDFAGGMAGRAAFMKAMGYQIAVPGEGWMVAELPNPDMPLAAATWCVQSTDSIRQRGRTNMGEPLLEVRVDDQHWRPLLPESLPVRVWEPDPQYPWRATSATEPAIPIMRRIDLLDRRLVAMLVSRLAMNGMLLIPQEGQFPTVEEYADAPDPFVAMLLDIASKNIASPGQASAAIPMPIRYPSEFIEKWRWITFGDPMDEHLLAERDKEIGRLATTLNIASERLTGGMSKANHWSAWQMDEEEIQTSISPPAETICHGLTVGYLQPMLMSAGASPIGRNGGRILVWYDTSELTARPDKSGSALNLYDRLEISGTALRRESGFDESDAPRPDELDDMVWKKAAAAPELAPTAAEKLSGQPQPQPPQSPAAGGGLGPEDGVATPSDGTSPAAGPPPTQDNPPPAPSAAALRRIVSTALEVERPRTVAAVAAAVRPATPPADDPPVKANGHRHHR